MISAKQIEELTESDCICETPRENFTIIPNDLIRCPELTGAAYKVLCIILSNEKGWKTRITQIRKQTKDGKQAVATAVALLKEKGYLRKYVVKNPKGHFCSSFYAVTHTAGRFDIREREELLTELGYSITAEKSKNPKTRFSESDPELNNQSGPAMITDGAETRPARNPAPKNTILKEDNNKEDYNKKTVATEVATDCSSTTSDQLLPIGETKLTFPDTKLNNNSVPIVETESTSPNRKSNDEPVPIEKPVQNPAPKKEPRKKRVSTQDKVNNSHRMLSRRLFKAVMEAETASIPGMSAHRPEEERKQQAKKLQANWALDFAKMEFLDGIPVEEIKETMNWYERNIDVKFTPEARCGRKFRSKYTSILNAINRSKKREAPKMSPANNSKYLREQAVKPKKSRVYTLEELGLGQ